MKNIIKNPIGNKNIFFRRTTSRYAQKGTISHNVGYFYVSRDAITGQLLKDKNKLNNSLQVNYNDVVLLV
jgi:hypothetical protein